MIFKGLKTFKEHGEYLKGLYEGLDRFKRISGSLRDFLKVLSGDEKLKGV